MSETPAPPAAMAPFTYNELWCLGELSRGYYQVLADDYRKRAEEQDTPEKRADWLQSADDHARRAAGFTKIMEILDRCGTDADIKHRLRVLAQREAERNAAVDKPADGDAE